MIRTPTPEEYKDFRKWARKVGRFGGFPTSNLRADDMQELSVQGRGDLLIFSPAKIRELLEKQ